MMKSLSLVALAAVAGFLASCATEPVHVHHYHTRTVKAKPAPAPSTPESFQAVTPPASYSQ